jgi:catechol 2,3-dioxygenase-like lactoylglutathione lyase family enzyme
MKQRIYYTCAAVIAAGIVFASLALAQDKTKSDPKTGYEIPVSKAGGQAMLEKILYVFVFVKDQDKALDFYTNMLGFEKLVDSPNANGPRFVAVGLKGQDLALVLWPGTPGQAQPIAGRIPAQYTIQTGDCRKALETLKSRGVRFDTEVLEFPWGYVAVFQDLDGNRLQLRQGR